jgi:hypothetical protein
VCQEDFLLARFDETVVRQQDSASPCWTHLSSRLSSCLGGWEELSDKVHEKLKGTKNVFKRGDDRSKTAI